MGLLIGDVFRRAAAATPARAAASLGDDVLTFAELDAQANTIAGALRGQGIEHGRRVAWWGEMTLAAVPLFAALAKLGAVFVPLNPRLTEEERVAAGLDAYDPDEVPSATDTPPQPEDITQTEEWQEERAEVRRELDKDELGPIAEREPFPPTRYE